MTLCDMKIGQRAYFVEDQFYYKSKIIIIEKEKEGVWSFHCENGGSCHHIPDRNIAARIYGGIAFTAPSLSKMEKDEREIVLTKEIPPFTFGHMMSDEKYIAYYKEVDNKLEEEN